MANQTKEKNYRICSQSVMDTEGTEIEFDDNGVSQYVPKFLADLGYLPKTDAERDAQLRRYVRQIKKAGTGKKYDCIVGMSGGVDSTYVAYIAKNLGLRPLAVHVDNGWNSELAVCNIENAVKKLGIDLYTHVIDWPSFRDLQVSFLNASVSDAEMPSDHANRAVLMKMAAKHKVRYSLTGRNLKTEGILGSNWSYGNLDWKYIKSIHRQFGSRKLRGYPHCGLVEMLYYVSVLKITDVPILNFVPYTKNEALQTMKNELGYREYEAKHYESIYTRFFQSYILPKKFRIDKRKAHLSVLILTGQMTREEALQILKEPPYDEEKIGEEREFVVKKLGLTMGEFEEIMSLPIKRYTDYPNNSKYLLFNKNKKMLAFVRALKMLHIFPKEFAARAVNQDEGASTLSTSNRPGSECLLSNG
ncbi:MAG: N-acetyl sugar amidotransferase [Chitinivibrionales bacterium]|nr:N-acetyl sugar amidotransferase [Chitinivibrionales bacterium]